jgi:hypothetical protein
MNKDALLFGCHGLDYKLVQYDLNQEKIVSKFFPAMENEFSLPFPPINRISGNKIIVMRDYNDTVYVLNDNELKPYAFIEYENALTQEQIQDLRKTGRMYRKFPKGSMNDTQDYWETDDYISFNFTMNRRSHFYLFNKASSKALIYRDDLPNDLFGSKWFPLNVRGQYKNSIIIDEEASVLLENKENMSVELPDGLDLNSNNVLIFYHPKFVNSCMIN